jgi:hypothetical protein
MESRASLVFRHLLKGEKRNTNHNIDNGGQPSLEATPFVATFCSTFDIVSTTHSCTTLQKYYRKHHVCHHSNGEFGNHGDPRRRIHEKKQMVDSKIIIYHYYDLDNELGFSMNTLTRAVKLFDSIVDSKGSPSSHPSFHQLPHP